MKTENVNVVGITETRSKAEIFVSEIEIPGFRLYRKDREVVTDKKGWCSSVCKKFHTSC